MKEKLKYLPPSVSCVIKNLERDVIMASELGVEWTWDEDLGGKTWE